MQTSDDESGSILVISPSREAHSAPYLWTMNTREQHLKPVGRLLDMLDDRKVPVGPEADV